MSNIGLFMGDIGLFHTCREASRETLLLRYGANEPYLSRGAAATRCLGHQRRQRGEAPCSQLQLPLTIGSEGGG